VENKTHWVRDVVFAEDHQNAYLGAAAHGMALFRNLAIGLIPSPATPRSNAPCNTSPPTEPEPCHSWPHPDHDSHDFAFTLTYTVSMESLRRMCGNAMSHPCRSGHGALETISTMCWTPPRRRITAAA
jgi:hypothetical protein